jgi:chemotaxis signal transduction protein
MSELVRIEAATKREMITFLVGNQEFCVDILSVHGVFP